MKDLRRLIYVPILHAQKDSGRTDAVLAQKEGRSAVEEMWAGIATKVAGLSLPWNRTRIYQDGVPVCGNELALATRLAQSGNPNFAFLLELIAKGATLEGTEDMDLLIQEYDLLNRMLMAEPGADHKASNAEYQEKSRELLGARDLFIRERISATLRKGEVPMVFLGVMHRLDKMLEKDFLVSYVIYRLPFRSIGTIYNA